MGDREDAKQAQRESTQRLVTKLAKEHAPNLPPPVLVAAVPDERLDGLSSIDKLTAVFEDTFRAFEEAFADPRVTEMLRAALKIENRYRTTRKRRKAWRRWARGQVKR